MVWRSCPVVSFLSTLDGDVRVPSLYTQGCRNWNPPKSFTHKREVKPHSRFILGVGSFLLDRCSAV